MNNLNREEIVRQLRLAKNQLEMTLEDWRGRIEAPTLFAAQQNTIEALGSSAGSHRGPRQGGYKLLVKKLYIMSVLFQQSLS